ncbi:N(G),N(G)-dimethylarginine dimethylaminohydrolase 1 [Arctopsyche grandis]|uniref:N(G),N(G)-dimethylarginine dimethylaminohydrolase 1 n=1 Tax=Arctopsyche grandis TaxID=121162 RepID=UPI00406D84BD
MPLGCTHALVARVPLSLRTRAQLELDEARRQHDCYVRLLRELGLDVLELPPDEDRPTATFVEEAAIVCNGTALITRPANPRDPAQADIIRAILKKELDLSIVEVTDENAKLEGGDVLFTGKEFFIGLSQGSNEAGARAVAAAFPEYPCTPIKVSSMKRLKAFVTMAGPDVLCVGASQEAQEVLKRIEREAIYSYQTLTVPEDAAANCLYVNGTLIHRAIEEIPESFKVFCEKVDFARRSICFSELSKISNGLTSCCLLIKRPKYFKSL